MVSCSIGCGLPFLLFFECVKWLAPVGLPRLTEHFWKCLLSMSLREKVSSQRPHEYGLTPVSVPALV